MLRSLRILLLLSPLLAGAAEAPGLDRFAVVATAPVTTWIYVGTVTLTATPFIHRDGQFTSTYTAKVFPYFFSSEAGRMTVNAPPAALALITSGRPMPFTGTAVRSDGTVRVIDGLATPTSDRGGTIKVRIHLSKKLTLVFDTTYRLGGRAPVKSSAIRRPGSPRRPG